MTDPIAYHLDGDVVRAEIPLGNRFVAPSLIAGLAPPSLTGVRMLLIGGRGPAWLYAALALAGREAGTDVATFDPQLGGHVLCHGVDIGRVIGAEPGAVRPVAAPSERPLAISHDARGVGRLSFARSEENLSPGDLPSISRSLAARVDSIGPNELICWDAPSPIWVSTHVACRLADLRPDLAIGIHAPQHGVTVIVHRGSSAAYLPGTVLPDVVSNLHPPRIIGIVGDPNSGKSVFSWKLYRALHRREAQAYRLDCDVQAPTNLWGITTPLGRQLRMDQKRVWDDPRDVPMLVEAVRGLARSSLDIVLVDLPGGLHKADLVQRIPPGRRALFQAIREYIIVQKSDEVAAAWRSDLAAVTPGATIVAEILSRLAPAHDSGRPAAAGQWRVDPLDRATWHEPDAAIDQFAKSLLDSQ